MVFWKKNSGKCHMLIHNGTKITSSNNKQLLGVRIDKKLSCDIHLKSLCKKEGQNLSALARINTYLTLE